MATELQHRDLARTAFKGLLGFLFFQIFFLPNVSFAQLAAPSPGSPMGYITNQSPSFEWDDVPGAASYEFNLMDDTDSVVYFRQDGIGESTFTIVGAVFDQSKAYHWRVRAFEADGTPGAWSEIESFLIYDPSLIPSLSAPGGYILTATPNFVWSTVNGAVNYDLVVMNETETVTINYVGSIVDTSFQQPPNMPFVPYTIYHYKVRSRMPNGTVSLWSNPGSFMNYSQTDTPRPISPSVKAPLGQTNFDWTPVENAIGYDFLLMSADETVVIANVSNLSVNGYTPSADLNLATGVVYHWKVRSVLAGGRSAWSDTFSFAFFDPMFVPESIYPFGFMTGNSLLEWTQVPNAVAYDVEMRDSATGTVVLSDRVSGTTSYDYTKKAKLVRDRVYEWRVRSVSSSSESVWSLPKGFKITKSLWEGLIAKKKLTALYYPKQSVSFTWNALTTANASEYYYRVILRGSCGTGCMETVWDEFTDVGAAAELSLPSSVSLNPRADYYWFVQAYDANDDLVGTSKRFTFRTPAPVPAEDFKAKLDDLAQQQATAMDKLLADQKAKYAESVAKYADQIAKLEQQLETAKATKTTQKQTLEKKVADAVANRDTSLATLAASQKAAAEKLAADNATKYAAQVEKYKASLADLEQQLAKATKAATADSLKKKIADTIAARDSALSTMAASQKAAVDKMASDQQAKYEDQDEKLQATIAAARAQLAKAVADTASVDNLVKRIADAAADRDEKLAALVASQKAAVEKLQAQTLAKQASLAKQLGRLHLRMK